MVLFPEINQAPPPYSMLQHTGRVATPKLVPRNCLRYLQTTLRMGGGGLVSEFMCGVVADSYIMNKQCSWCMEYFILGYTAQSTKFGKFINILYNKNLWGVTLIEVFCKDFVNISYANTCILLREMFFQSMGTF